MYVLKFKAFINPQHYSLFHNTIIRTKKLLMSLSMIKLSAPKNVIIIIDQVMGALNIYNEKVAQKENIIAIAYMEFELN